MKNKKTGAVNRAKKKHTKNVARKGKGAQYGASVKQLKHINSFIEQVEVMGPTNQEVLNDTFVEQDPTQTLKDKMAKAIKGTIDIS